MKFQSLMAAILLLLLDYLFHDDHIAAANEAPAAPLDAIDVAPTQPPMPAHADGAAVDAALPEPLPLGLLGAGIVMLGWTRRQGGWLSGSSARSVLARAMWPWSSLPWLA